MRALTYTLVLIVATIACVLLASGADATPSAASSAAAASVPSDVLSRVARGGLLAPSSQSKLRRILDGMTPAQRESLRREGLAHQELLAARAAAAPALSAEQRAAGPDWSQVPAFVNALMECRGVSGLSIGVVKGGEVVYSQGFGVQSASGPAVDSDTIFGIGSCTKAFTSSLGAILQQDGVFHFDDLVTDYLPDYRLENEHATAFLTTTDLLTHRTGLASHDTALFLDHKANRRDRVYAAKYIVPESSFRSTYWYNNWMVMSAGYLIGEVGNRAINNPCSSDDCWEQLVSSRIFRPLSMSRTCSNFSQCVSATNRATPMRFDASTKSWKNMPFELNELIDQAAPCGGVASSARDMSRWVAAQLGHAPHVLTASSLHTLHSPRMTVPDSRYMPSWLWNRVNGVGYAYSWWTAQYTSPGLKTQGQKLVFHEGDVWGFQGFVAMLPESDLGLVLLSNSNSADDGVNQMWWRNILSWFLFDLALQDPAPTFANAAEACAFPCNYYPSLCTGAKTDAAAPAPKPTPAPAAGAAPSSCTPNLADYIGTFYEPAWGFVRVSYTDPSHSQLLLSVGNFPLAPTNASLSFQSFGGCDNFVWNILGEDDAQDLTDSHVTFLRNTGASDMTLGAPGSVQALYLDTVDDAGATYRILFVRTDDKAEEEVEEAASAHATLLSARNKAAKVNPRSLRAAAEASLIVGAEQQQQSSSSTGLSPSGTLIIAICASIIVSVVLAGAIFAHFAAKQTRAIKDIIDAQQGAGAADYRLLQRS